MSSRSLNGASGILPGQLQKAVASGKGFFLSLLKNQFWGRTSQVLKSMGATRHSGAFQPLPQVLGGTAKLALS